MRSLQSLSLRVLHHCGVGFQASSWALVWDHCPLKPPETNFLPGPAHAVYFATYEAVKQAMGGNEGNEHHPLAAGRDTIPMTCGAFFNETI